MEVQDQIIALETAKLAKEKGYDIFGYGSYTEYLINQVDPEYPEGGGSFSMTKGEVVFDNAYFKNGYEKSDYSCETYYMCAAPTQTLLARWLREVHGIHIEIYTNASGYGYILTKTNGTVIKEIEDDIFFESNEIALEIGLTITLERI